MSITRGELKGNILSLLNKSPGYQGFYSDDKINPIIQECIDYIATNMFMDGSGWMNEQRLLNTTSNTVSVRIPEDFAMISHVRYLISNLYQPLMYNNDPYAPEWSAQSGQTQYPSVYRILGDQIYFNPAVAVGGPDNIQIEGMTYPPTLKTDSNFIQAKFHRGFINFIKYRAASILAASVGKANPEWAPYMAQWEAVMISCISKRIADPKPISDFDG